MAVAPTPRSGKSYAADVASAIATGTPCPVITPGRSDEEMEKHLDAMLLQGTALYSIDNASRDIGGDKLNVILTQSIVRPRILGKSEAPECESRATIFATGNNVTFTGDTAMRGLIAHIDSGLEDPERRRFNGNPYKAVLADRSKYISAILTLARAYEAAGRPEHTALTPWNGFEGWCLRVREPLIWAGASDPLESLRRVKEDNPERRGALDLIEQWRVVIGQDQPVRVNEIILKATAQREVTNSSATLPEYEFVNPEFRTVLLLSRAGRGNTVDAKALGRWLTLLRDRPFNGFRIEVALEDGTRGNKWVLRGPPLSEQAM